MSGSGIDGQAALEAMVDVTERLTALLAEQARAFEQHRPQDAAAGLPEITRLSNIYRAGAAGICMQASIMTNAPPQLRQRLLRAIEAFEAVLERQGRSLAASKTVTEGVVKAIADEIARRRAVGRAYGPGAERRPDATAITLNQRA